MNESVPPQAPEMSGKQQPCMRCGYDLRGSRSQYCPECGTPTAVALRVQGQEQYFNVKAALEHARLLMRHRDPGGTLGTYAQLIGGMADFGVVWVPTTELEAVEAVFDSLQVPMPLAALPIVDISETQCPQCKEPLDHNGPDRCGHCGLQFQWVDIDEPDLTGAALTCQCGYDLQGLTSDRCPECGCLLPADVHRLVALADHPQAEREDVDRARKHFSFRSLLPPLGVFLALLGLYTWSFDAKDGLMLVLVGVGLIIAGMRPSSSPD